MNSILLKLVLNLWSKNLPLNAEFKLLLSRQSPSVITPSAEPVSTEEVGVYLSQPIWFGYSYKCNVQLAKTTFSA